MIKLVLLIFMLAALCTHVHMHFRLVCCATAINALRAVSAPALQISGEKVIPAHVARKMALSK